MLSNVILGSASPRRQELIQLLDISPVILPATGEEKRTTDDPEKLVESLAVQKAESVAAGLFFAEEEAQRAAFSGKELVIGADTMVACEGKVLGKPKTHAEAADMIRLLQGRSHQVYTGVAVIGADGRRKSFVERTDVRVAPMTEAEILLYAESEHPMDKAGAYGIQGPFAVFVEGLDGDYYNVMGLPVHRLYKVLQEMQQG
ncbi:MAG: Maf family protein [Lachnospiraceae bacterium]|nr:Maf family protein [Lachnospiraceae bacterium]